MSIAPLDIAVIVVVYNKLHPACLTSLKRVVELSPLSIEVVVVDNASPNLDVATMTHEAYPKAHLIVCRKTMVLGGRVIEALAYSTLPTSFSSIQTLF